MAVGSMLAAVCVLVSTGCTTSRPQAFDSPAQATDALIQALRDRSAERVKQILGPQTEDVLWSGDAVADRNAADAFLRKYDQKHQLVNDTDEQVTLVVGDNDWPLPIPLVRDEKQQWFFDLESGKEELINRRIGRNELDVIEVCKAIVDAQREYATRDPDGDGVPEYAQRFISDEGKRDGLYWPTAEGEPLSPLGPLVAEAAAEGYGARASAAPAGQPRPYHGYCYRLLKAQGPSAAGGAREYLVNGKMIGGFALIAWPAEYGNSGIMSFMVSHEGVLYEKDLGEESAKVAQAMGAFDPGSGWQKVEPPASRR